MAKVYLSGCKWRARFPEASEWFTEQVVAHGYAEKGTDACCRDMWDKLGEEDTAVLICNNCMAMIEEASDCNIENIWTIIDQDPDFELPDYSGLTVGVQDCGRSYNRTDVQDAVRSILHKMNIETVELPDAREKSRFCGMSFLKAVPPVDAKLAPWRYVEDAEKRGIFAGLDEEAAMKALKEHCDAINVDLVCDYCFACDAGLEMGGQKAVNLIELVSGKFRNGSPLD